MPHYMPGESSLQGSGLSCCAIKPRPKGALRLAHLAFLARFLAAQPLLNSLQKVREVTAQVIQGSSRGLLSSIQAGCVGLKDAVQAKCTPQSVNGHRLAGGAPLKQPRAAIGGARPWTMHGPRGEVVVQQIPAACWPET